jgi:hypothetical protein
MFSESDVKKTFSLTVSVEAGASFGSFGGSFRASTSYNEMVRDITSESNFYVTSKAECLVYEASLNRYLFPKFHPNFLAGLDNLADDPADYY